MTFGVVLFSGKLEFRENPPSDGHTLCKGTNKFIPVFFLYFVTDLGEIPCWGFSVQCYQAAVGFTEIGAVKAILYLMA
jgi:hypothetical protein